MRIDLMVGQEVVLHDPIPWTTVVVVLLVTLCPEILVIALSNQKVNILTGVRHGRFPLVLKILLHRKRTAVTRQIGQQQELQTPVIYGPPIVGIRLKTLIQFFHAIDNGLQSNLKKSR